LLYQGMRKTFPELDVQLNYGYRPPLSKRPIEFNIFISELSLALEYNSEKHYMEIPILNNNLATIRERDKMKQQICQNNGITLLVIPFWWNKTIESVAQVIHKARPDILFPDSLLKGYPIPIDMPIKKEIG